MIELRVGKTSDNTLDRWVASVVYYDEPSTPGAGVSGGVERTRAVPFKWVAKLLGRRLYNDLARRYS